MKTAPLLTAEWESDFASPQEGAIPLLLALSDSALRRVLSAVFSAAGYRPVYAETGREAAELLQRQNFPILITELELPGGGGLQLARELAKRDSLAECVLLACPQNVERVMDAADSGLIYNHFWKPLHDAGDLIRCAGRAMERREMRSQQSRLLTDLRETREENRVYCSRLEQLDKVVALGHMTETVAQSLHAPLANLRAYAQYLHARIQRQENAPLSSEQIARIQDYLRDMEKGALRCESAVSQVLDYTRIHDEPAEPTCPVTALDAALALLRDGIEAQGITMRLHIPKELPPVLANSRRFQQAIISLICNAQQALGKSGGILAVSAETAESGDKLEIRVEDSGPGIAPEVLPHIFTPFFSTRSRQENLGLGLTIARGMAREWNGDLRVTNGPERGVAAVLTLPLCDEILLPRLHLAHFDGEESRLAA